MLFLSRGSYEILVGGKGMILKRILGAIILLTLGFLVFSVSSVMLGLIVLFATASPWWLSLVGSIGCSLMLVIYWLEKR